MEYRVENIIKTLEGLPEPQYDRQVLSVRVKTASWEYSLSSIKEEDPCIQQISPIIVTAKQYSKNHKKWLEWVCDI